MADNSPWSVTGGIHGTSMSTFMFVYFFVENGTDMNDLQAVFHRIPSRIHEPMACSGMLEGRTVSEVRFSMEIRTFDIRGLVTPLGELSARNRVNSSFADMASVAAMCRGSRNLCSDGR